MNTRVLRPLLILPTSSMRSKRRSVKSCSTLKHAHLLITSGPHASAAMRAPALVAMEAKRTIPLTLVIPPATGGEDFITRVKNGKEFDLRYALHHFGELSQR